MPFWASQLRENYFLSLLGAMDTIQEGTIEMPALLMQV